MNIDRIIAIIALLIATFAVYKDEFVSNKPILDVKKIYISKIMDNEKDSDLYQIRYRITNIGNSSIITNGKNKNLLTDGLSIRLSNISKFERLQFFHLFPIKDILIEEDNLKLIFTQWMPKEYIEFSLNIKITDINKEIGVFINKHQLDNGLIKYTFGSKKDSLFIIKDDKLYLKEN